MQKKKLKFCLLVLPRAVNVINILNMILMVLLVNEAQMSNVCSQVFDDFMLFFVSSESQTIVQKQLCSKC